MTGRWTRESRHGAAAPAPSAPPRLVAPLGQGAMLLHWQRLARTLALPHALVVEGAPGTGKSTVMRWLAASLLCPSDLDQSGPCGSCRTCMRVAAGAFPDVHLVDRARDEDDKEENKKSWYVIAVDQVREAQEILLRRPVEGRARVLLIADADTMEEAAQNALLKTLEEPGDATFLLLEARRPERLLPTVRSRVQRLRLVPLDDTAIRRELGNRLPARAAVFERAIGLARGSLGQALAVCTEQVVQVHDLVLAVLATTKGLRPLETARLALEGFPERHEAVRAARLFLWLLRSELRRRIDGLAAATADSYVAALAEPWTTWLETTLAAERDLDMQIPPDQALVACLVEFAAS